MLKVTLSFILFGYINAVSIKTCPEGTGTVDNCCRFEPNALEEAELIVVPSTIDCVVVDCGANEKGCEKEISVYSGAGQTEILCAVQDTCLASTFIGGRGPPGYDQRDFDRPDQTFKVTISAGSSAKEANVRVFGNVNLELASTAQAGFTDASLACFNNPDKACNVICENEGCEKIDCEGRDPNTMSEFCSPSSQPLAEFQANVAIPDTNGNCEITPTQGFKGKYIFKNDCNKATLNCNTQADICGKAVVISGANDLEIVCGGEDPQKTDGSLISGGCKEMKLSMGPLANVPDCRPTAVCSEEDFDISYEPDVTDPLTGDVVTRGDPILNTATITLIGSDAMAKGDIDAVLTKLVIDAQSDKSAGEMRIDCGYNPEVPDGRTIPGATCTLKCLKDTLNGVNGCDKCVVEQFGASFVSIVRDAQGVEGPGETCTPPLSNRVVQRGAAIDGEGGNNGVQYENDIIIPVKSVYAFAIIFAVIVVAVIFGCYGFNNKNNIEKQELLKYNTMEMQQRSIQNIA